MGPPAVPRVPISGPHHGIFSKLNGPGPLGSGGHSHTSFSTGEFHGEYVTETRVLCGSAFKFNI